MHIYCPNCGKHIDVSIQEIEKLEGHYVCPQCLSEINLDGFEQIAADYDYFDDEAQQETPGEQPQQPATTQEATSTPTPTTAAATVQPPQYKPAATTEQHRDDVLRYCRNCGTFLREGINYCPKCGKYVKVQPPAYQGPKQATAATTATASSPAAHTNYAPRNNYDNRNRVRPPMASNTRKPAKSRTSRSNDTGRPTGIFSIAGCLTFTIIAVAIFFIAYILLGSHFDGITAN